MKTYTTNDMKADPLLAEFFTKYGIPFTVDENKKECFYNISDEGELLVALMFRITTPDEDTIYLDSEDLRYKLGRP
jgi:hypothetical protein